MQGNRALNRSLVMEADSLGGHGVLIREGGFFQRETVFGGDATMQGGNGEGEAAVELKLLPFRSTRRRVSRRGASFSTDTVTLGQRRVP